MFDKRNFEEALRRSLGILSQNAKEEYKLMPDRSLPYLAALAQHLRYHPIED